MALTSLSKANLRYGLWVLVFLIAPVLMAGCGKKGPPRLPDAAPPAGVRDLSAARVGDDVVLKWTALDGEAAVASAGYHVYRSAEPADEEACEGCPVLFRRAARVPLAAGASGPQSLEYREPLVPGTRYRFKVVPYDAAGQLGPDSNIVRIVTE